MKQHDALRVALGLLYTIPILAACDGDDDGTGPPTGSIAVTAATTGDDLDPDGYTLSVDGGAGQSIGISASTTFTGVAPGDREVELTGVAPNCTVAGPDRMWNGTVYYDISL